MTPGTLTFDIDHPGEPGAGIIGYSDRVTVDVKSGDPGGDPGEFQEHMRSALAEWFDGAAVRLAPEDPAPPKKEGRSAMVRVRSLAGDVEKPCRVVGETPKRFRIEVDQPTAMPPNLSFLMPGYQRLVPKHAIRFLED